MPSDQTPTEEQQAMFTRWGLQVPRTQAAALAVIECMKRGNVTMRGTQEERVTEWRRLQKQYEGRKVIQRGTGRVGRVLHLIPIPQHERLLATTIPDRYQMIPHRAKAVVKWDGQRIARWASLDSFEIKNG